MHQDRIAGIKGYLKREAYPELLAVHPSNAYLSKNIPPMQLVLSVSGKVLDRVNMDPTLYKDEEYLQSLRRLLLTKNELSILALKEEPVLYIEVPSRSNR